MADFNFVIPVIRDELLANNSRSEYAVQELLSTTEMQQRMQVCRSSLDEDGPDFIFTHFDVIYSSLFNFGEMENEDRRQVFNITSNGVERLHAELSLRLDDGEKLMEDERKRCVNALKMLCYLLCKLIEAFESESCRISSQNIVPTGKGRKTAKKTKMSSRLSDEGWDWHGNMLHAMTLLQQMTTLPIYILWSPPVLEEDFVNLLCNMCYKVMENPGINREGQLKSVIFHLLGKMISKYNHAIAGSLKFVQLLQYHEHLVAPLAEAVQIFMVEYNVNNFLSEIIREVGRIQSQDAACDAASSRAFAAFLAEIARANPAAVKSNMHILISYLDGESYTMVNCVLTIMGEIILSVCKDGEELDRKTRFMRDKFMDKLESHICDIHAYVRSKALQIWMRLSEHDAIPLQRKHKIVRLAKERLMDKTATVRKNAMQLLTAFLSNNPFAATLKLEELKASLEVENKKLLEMQPQLADQVDNEEVSEDDDEEEERDEPLEVPEDKELTKQKIFVNYLKDCIAFIIEFNEAMSIVSTLLMSSQTSDVLESVQFSVAAQKFGINNSIVGVRKMLPLIFSKETAVRDVVVVAFKSLYLESKSVQTLVNSLITLTTGASIGEMISLEQLVFECVQSGEIGESVFKRLWRIFCNPDGNCGIGEIRAAIKLIGMAAKAVPDLVRSHLGVIVKFGLGPQAETDFQLARDVCGTILKLASNSKEGSENKNRTQMFPPDCDVIKRVTEILVGGLSCSDDDTWIPFAEQATKVIYAFTEHPDIIVGKIIKDFHQIVTQGSTEDEPTCDAFMLTRFVAFVGMVASRQLIHLDVSVLAELKRRRALEDAKKHEFRKSHLDRRRFLSMSSGSVRSRNKMSLDDTYDAIEAELGLTNNDDADAEYIRDICDTALVTGNNLLAFLSPTIVTICSNPGKFGDPGLCSLGTVALAKFMMVSSGFCETSIQLLFTILERSSSAVIRLNLICAIGDLYRRFPNLVEPWTPQLYGRLRDDSVSVRRCAVTILSQLILNDMVKVKGQISELALLCVDSDQCVMELAGSLFTKLSQKDNAIYNILPDIISNLSDPGRNVDEDHFRTIMKFLLGFVQKDRQAECLVEKCCHRIGESTNERQWRDLSYCTSLLCTTDKCVRKLLDNFTCYDAKLVDTQVYQLFISMVAALKKIIKLDLKNLLEELEAKIEDSHKKSTEDEAVLANVNRVKGKSRQNGNGVARTSRKAPKRQESTDSSDSDFESSTRKTKKLPSPTSKSRSTRKKTRSILTPLNSKPVSKKAATRKAMLVKLFESSDSDSSQPVLDTSDTENVMVPRVTRNRVQRNSTK